MIVGLCLSARLLFFSHDAKPRRTGRTGGVLLLGGHRWSSSRDDSGTSSRVTRQSNTIFQKTRTVASNAACRVVCGTTLTCRVQDTPILLAILGPQHSPGRPIDEMQLRAGEASDELIAVRIRRDLIRRPALHELTGVRATIDKSSHRAVIALIDGDVPCACPIAISVAALHECALACKLSNARAMVVPIAAGSRCWGQRAAIGTGVLWGWVTKSDTI